MVLEWLDVVTPSEPTITADYVNSPGWRVVRPAKHRSGYSAVNREFQHFFEGVNFAYLELSQNDVQEFGRITAGQNIYRLNYVRRLWLRVILPTYDCDACQKPEDSLTRANNNAVFTRALVLLLDILSRWKKKDMLQPQQVSKGMILELSAQSPSDAQHSFLRCFHLRESYPYKVSPDGLKLRKRFKDWFYFMDRSLVVGRKNDEFHHLEGGIPNRSLPNGAKARLHGTPLELNYRNSPLDHKRRTRNKLPTVELVTGLSFRRQFFRTLAPSMVRKLMEGLVCLQDFRYEFWLPSPSWQVSDVYFRAELKTLLRSGLPTTLRRLSLFRDFDHRFTVQQFNKPAPPTRKCDSLALAEASHQLEVLSSSWITDAADFFAAPKRESSPWPFLRHLALTTSYLHPERPHDLMNSVIGLAAVAASQMPNLEKMEIWSCGGWRNCLGHACIFRYGFNEVDGSVITWSSTWPDERELVFSKAVIRAWKAVAEGRKGGRPLRVERRPLVDVNIESCFNQWQFHAAVIPRLELKKEVLEGLSRFQLATELKSPLWNLRWVT
ncbi:hypothetical protein QBC41DRAFT_225771 [Cercophora samala]|uniref:DUF6546 domain-containing protein n=1 Tax=Cercophora samala TaxID=330535 RepID=A0AA39ZDA7_9PEZI|nr:hypothetical protein QBC41DRAFT_225771 [Cercophora samala]